MLKPIMAALFAAIFVSLSPFVSAQDDPFAELSGQLPSANFKRLPAILSKFANLTDPRVNELFDHLLEGEVYYHPKTRQLLYITEHNGERVYQDVLRLVPVAALNGVRLRKVRVNNRVRSHIRLLKAERNLSHEDSGVRLAAAAALLSNVDDVSEATLQQRLVEETDEGTRYILNTISALKALASDTDSEKLAALNTLRGNLQPEVRAALLQLQQAGELTENVLASLNATLAGIETQREWYGWAENLFFGISMGSVLLLAAIGLAITFGVMGVINMAHGEMIMLGAYTTYVVQLVFPNLIEYSLFIAIPAAFCVSGLVGVLIERSVIQFLKGRPLETLLATFGISLILQQAVRTVFSPLNRQVASPQWMSGSLQLNPVFSVTFNRLYIILFSLSVFFALLLFLKKSSLGLHVRAVAQDRDMARALSIKSNWVDAATFGLGSGIAGVAGVVLSQLTNVGPNLGQAYIIDSFLVVVFGGVANLWGTLVSAMVLGVVNKFLEPITGPVLATIIVLVGLVFFIQKKPMGLFPQKGRSD
jgi:urea transport system permease protein